MVRAIPEVSLLTGRRRAAETAALGIPLHRRTGVRLWILFLLLLLPIVAHGVVMEVKNRQERFQHELDMLSDRVDGAEQVKSVLFQATHDILRALSQIEAVRSGDDAACSETLARVATQYRQYTAFTRVDARGRITCSSQPIGRPLDVSGDPALLNAFSSRIALVSPVATGPISGQRIIVFSLPILNPSGDAIGIVNTGLDLAWFQAELAKAVPKDNAGLVLFDSRGSILAQLPAAGTSPAASPGSVAAPLGELVAERREGRGEYLNPNGVRVLASFVTRDDMLGGLHIAAYIPAATIDADLDRDLRDRLAVLAAVILLSMAVFWAAADFLILRGVRSLMQQAERLAHGDLRVRSTVPEAGAAELRLLGDAYDRMAEELLAREQALTTSEARLRIALESAAMGMADYDLRSGRFIRSPLVDEMFGFPLDGVERDGEEFYARVHPEDAVEVRRVFREAASSGGHVNIEYRVRWPDGTVRWISSRGEVMPSPDDLAPRYLGVLRDVTERRRMERALRESEERFRTMANSVPDILFIQRSDGTCEYHNQRFYDLTGLSMAEEASTYGTAVLHPDDRERYLQRWASSGRTGAVFEDECRVRMADGGYRWFVVRAFPVRDANGDIRRWMGSAADIDDRKRAEQALHAARLEAERANRAKSRFLAAASHDLRQPLNAMSLFLGVLQTHVDEVGKTVVPQIQTSLDAMIELFNALLDLSKLESGAVEIEVKPVPAAPILERLRTDFSGMAKAKGLDLRVVPSRGVLMTDAPLLERILRNLVSNAIRYTESGKVLVGCRRRGDVLRIEVHDTGPGIPPEDQRRVFEEFFQLANPARQRDGGHGLGLAIAKRTADLLNHPLGLDSTPGRGSCFQVSVPLAGTSAFPGQAVTASAAKPSGATRKRVWVVEDDPLVSAAMALVLDELGCDVVSVESAAEAMALAEDADLDPDLVISDYRLPGDANGLAVIRAVRERLGDDVKVCIVTGDPADDIEPQARRAGAQLLRKPIRSQDLVRLLEDA
ncbi:PAS domain-containing protein [Azospirillum soli]|uniref:PAS domain-containing protein n=1 Tax=Azospirillum soli TaxID=1304799 RepID=UPI001AE0FECC|nr:PAS domain-containing protein [Azospirillum soli]MBP2311943.1 PAS domain S-box-containing protein [Azospirillum soli]